MNHGTKLPPQALAFLLAMRERFKFCRYDAAKLFNVSSTTIKYHTRNAVKASRYSVGISSLRYAWKHYLKHGRIPDACMIFDPAQETARFYDTTALRWWLDDFIGWHSLAYIATRMNRTRRMVKELLRRIDKTEPDKFWPRVYRYTIHNLAKLIRQETGYHMPDDQLADLCDRGTLRWYREGRARCIKPNDAEWMLENWKPGLQVPKHPGGIRWG